MNNFGKYIAIKEAFTKYQSNPPHSKRELNRMARNHKTCMNCDEKVWRFGGCELCFSCTTGESDASDDIELIELF